MFFIYLVIFLFSNVLGSYICFTPKNINCITPFYISNANFVNYCEKIRDNYKEKIFLYKELDYLEVKYNKWKLAIY